MEKHLLVLVVLLVSPSTSPAEEIHSTPLAKLQGGTLMICWKGPAEKVPAEVLVHFHGAPETVKKAYARSEFTGVLAVVNFPGLSRAYSQPIVDNPQLFNQVLQEAAWTVALASGKLEPVQWKHVHVSCFSAGYGAVRELLKVPATFDQIESLTTADSIYAGLSQEQPTRQVDEQNMRDFLRFAELAAQSKKTFVLSHSAEPTPYASTTETADYLLHSLKLARQPNQTLRLDTLQQETEARQGRFLVLAFQGITGQDHMKHLHQVDLLWNQMLRLRKEPAPVENEK